MRLKVRGWWLEVGVWCLALMPASAAQVTIERPDIRWLFGGFGFQNAEAQLTPLMTDEFRNERAVKAFRELSPSFSRVYVGRVGESKEALDRFADYYDQTFRHCDTTIYAVGGSMPGFPEKLDVRAHAEGVAKSLEYLIKQRDCRKIRYYCLTNELMCDDQWGYFKTNQALYRKFHEALYDAFRRHGLDIQLAASDGSFGRKQAEDLKWTVDSMDLITGIYCTHYYDRMTPGDPAAYGIFHEQFTNVVQLALTRTKRWMLGEFGIVPPRKKGVMVDDQNWTYHDSSQAGLWALTTAEMAMAAVNAGAYAVMSWSFCDYPDPFVVEDSHDPVGRARYESAKAVYKPDMKFNKWGVFRWSDVRKDYTAAPTYFTLGLMSRYFRKGASILTAKPDDPLLRATVLENPDATMTAAIVNLGPKRTVSLTGWTSAARPARVYRYDSAKPYANAFGDLPPYDATVRAEKGVLNVEIPEKGLVFVTTDYIERTPQPVKGVKVDARGDGRITWLASDDPDHCYYRVFRDGQQIASTVATYTGFKGEGRYTVVSVDRWGNVGTCVSEMTIQDRINEAFANGGGVVNIPAGRHIVGQLDLKSGVELHLEKGAVLEGTSDRSAYPKFTRPHSEGDWMGVIIATNAHDVAVTGEGLILGNGWTWVDLATHEAGSEGRRPRGLVFADCRNVRLEGFKLLDAPCWGIVFKKVDGVIARHVTIDNHCSSNNDGFDVEAKNVLIEDCDIDSSDDAIVIKSNSPDYTVENIVVRRCVCRSTGNAFKLGTASHGVMRNVVFEDSRGEMARRSHPDPRTGREWWAHWRTNWLNASKTLAGLNGFTVQCVDGGIVEKVTIRRCSLNGYNVPIFIRGGERYGRLWGIPVNNKWILRDILVEDVTGCAESSVASSITGAGKCRPTNVTLRNVKIVCKGAGDLYVPAPVPEASGTYPSSVIFGNGLPAWGLYVRHADGVRLENVDFKLTGADKREKIVTDDADVQVLADK